MGGGDLNTKKSWHPNTFKNQERVWKAEQADADEKRKLAELQHEIDEERNREELKSMAKKSGLIADTDGDRKLEWMYKGPQVNREEYLLGRTIDKTFEQLDAQEKAGPSVGISQPKNHVEHECIPFSIRQYKGLEGTEQVDIARKLMEDPLMAIKQKEVESRQKILENPVKLKELHRLLKSDRSIHERKDKNKKLKKKSKKKERKSSSDSESDSGNERQDLDKILAEKYKKIKSKEGDKIGLDKLLNMKYQKLSKELNKLAKPKKHRKNSSSSESNTSDSDSNNAREQSKRRHHGKDQDRSERYKSNKHSTERMRHRSVSNSPDRRDGRKRERSHRESYRFREDDRRRSPAAKRERSRSRDRRPHRHKSPIPSDSDSSSNEKGLPNRDDSDDDRKSSKARNFGLVSASGKKLHLSKRNEVRLYKREEIKAHQANQKPSWNRPEKKAPLTEGEIEARRKAMLQNAEWRDSERQKNVRRYEDEDRKEEQKEKNSKYDKNFITKQFKHAANNETVEKRIKSNRNNIQRAGGSMSTHFAKR
ncbi:pre-mRNA-splicing factor CWC25 homolog [Sabethes cyaneus]|uniref:pre-mRNA-splicing factor CWC25 homolog n=1 Tax=Sabethes cyaneus TaxID=53552 RepID=UPI00237D6DFE|nr:pre-mRNA-splicing factor CWC25 homolog [Sabethes cyaneus]